MHFVAILLLLYAACYRFCGGGSGSPACHIISGGGTAYLLPCYHACIVCMPVTCKHICITASFLPPLLPLHAGALPATISIPLCEGLLPPLLGFYLPSQPLLCVYAFLMYINISVPALHTPGILACTCHLTTQLTVCVIMVDSPP